jgi:hypothetical protein
MSYGTLSGSSLSPPVAGLALQVRHSSIPILFWIIINPFFLSYLSLWRRFALLDNTHPSQRQRDRGRVRPGDRRVGPHPLLPRSLHQPVRYRYVTSPLLEDLLIDLPTCYRPPRLPDLVPWPRHAQPRRRIGLHLAHDLHRARLGPCLLCNTDPSPDRIRTQLKLADYLF